MQEEFSKLVDAVLLPVVHSGDQVFQCLVEEGAVHGLVGALQHTLSGFYPCRQIGPCWFVLALLQQILL
jgi:hypothetical protein